MWKTFFVLWYTFPVDMIPNYVGGSNKYFGQFCAFKSAFTILDRYIEEIIELKIRGRYFLLYP